MHSRKVIEKGKSYRFVENDAYIRTLKNECQESGYTRDRRVEYQLVHRSLIRHWPEIITLHNLTKM